MDEFPAVPCPKRWHDINSSDRLAWISHREYTAANVWPISNVAMMRCIVASKRNSAVNQMFRYKRKRATMSGIITAMAAARGLQPAPFLDAVKKAVGQPNIGNETLCLYLLTCSKYDLDPMTGEVFLIEKGGRCSVNIGVDGWSKVVNRHAQFDGVSFQYEMHDGQLVAVTAQVKRKDRGAVTEATEWMAECRQNTPPWKTHPNRMLRHKAFQQACRLAFGLTMPEEVIDAESEFLTPEIEGATAAIEAVQSGDLADDSKIDQSRLFEEPAEIEPTEV